MDIAAILETTYSEVKLGTTGTFKGNTNFRVALTSDAAAFGLRLTFTFKGITTDGVLLHLSNIFARRSQESLCSLVIIYVFCDLPLCYSLSDRPIDPRYLYLF